MYIQFKGIKDRDLKDIFRLSSNIEKKSKELGVTLLFSFPDLYSNNPLDNGKSFTKTLTIPAVDSHFNFLIFGIQVNIEDFSVYPNLKNISRGIRIFNLHRAFCNRFGNVDEGEFREFLLSYKTSLKLVNSIRSFSNVYCPVKTDSIFYYFIGKFRNIRLNEVEFKEWITGINDMMLSVREYLLYMKRYIDWDSPTNMSSDLHLINKFHMEDITFVETFERLSVPLNLYIYNRILNIRDSEELLLYNYIELYQSKHGTDLGLENIIGDTVDSSIDNRFNDSFLLRKRAKNLINQVLGRKE